MVVIIPLLPPQILYEFNSEKNYENWSTFVEVIIKIKVARVFETWCSSILTQNVSKQAVRVATRYAPALLPPWVPKRLARRQADAT